VAAPASRPAEAQLTHGPGQHRVEHPVKPRPKTR
jgi:hypothetical protein